MGYSFYIGEAVLEDADLRDEEPGYALTVDVTVKEMVHKDAPNFEGDFLTEDTNHRSPSYTGWADFCREEGLYSLFYTDEGHLHGGHPGAIRLTPRYLTAVQTAIAQHKKKNKKLLPGWCQCSKCMVFGGVEGAPHVERDGNLARLLWLEWWIAYALINCKIPTLFNR